jgi:hypothetical protein
LRQATVRRLAAAAGFALVVACAALWHARSTPHAEPPVENEGGRPGASAAAAAGAAVQPPPAGGAPVRPAAAATPAQVAQLDEARLMARLRAASGTDPALAVQLAREGSRRFPDSPDAPERTSILIHALAGLGRSMEARGEAEEMVNHAPDSEWVREIERFTGAHRHRNVRINDAGVLEYQ